MRALSVVATVSVVAGANAAILFDQPRQTDTGYFSDSVNYTAGTTFWEQATADNFSLSTASIVNKVSFYGYSENVFSTPNLQNTLSFDIQVLNTSFGVVFSGNATLASLTPTAIGTAFNGATEYRLDFNTSIALGAGSYWLHVGGVYAAPMDDAFVWSSNRTNGNGISAFNQSSAGWATASNQINSVNHDQAFTLHGTAVPEPATMAVLGLGAAAILRRRRK